MYDNVNVSNEKKSLKNRQLGESVIMIINGVMYGGGLENSRFEFNGGQAFHDYRSSDRSCSRVSGSLLYKTLHELLITLLLGPFCLYLPYIVFYQK